MFAPRRYMREGLQMGHLLRSKRRRLVASTAIAIGLAITLTTPAQASVVVAGPGGFAAGYATPVIVAPAGGPLTFVNGDIPPHNVIAAEDFLKKKVAKKTDWCKDYPRKKCPIFWSETIAIGQTTEVLGLENTEPGEEYLFFCSLHTNMQGTLVTI